jgi:hypothetical protein
MAAGVLHACALREALAARATETDTDRSTCSGSTSASSTNSSDGRRKPDASSGGSSTSSRRGSSSGSRVGAAFDTDRSTSYYGNFNHAIAASHTRAIAVASPLGLSATLAAAGWNLQTAAFVDTACATSVVVPDAR